MVKKDAAATKSGADEGAVQASSAPAPSFEQAIAELEALVERMEHGDLSLEDSLAAYRRGAELVARCRKVLGDVQQQVRVLEGEVLKPLDTGSGDDRAEP